MAMLILTRKQGESLFIGGDVKVTIMEMKGNQVRVGIDAPSQTKIYREEIYLQILEENQLAAGGSALNDPLPELTNLNTEKAFGEVKMGQARVKQVGLSKAQPVKKSFNPKK
jgi:carbon storage regulator